MCPLPARPAPTPPLLRGRWRCRAGKRGGGALVGDVRAVAEVVLAQQLGVRGGELRDRQRRAVRLDDAPLPLLPVLGATGDVVLEEEAEADARHVEAVEDGVHLALDLVPLPPRLLPAQLDCAHGERLDNLPSPAASLGGGRVGG